MSKYSCPSCGAGFDKSAKHKSEPGVYCPECDVRLKAVREKVGTKFKIHYELDEEAMYKSNDATLVPTFEEEKVSNIEVLTKRLHENPQVAIEDGEYVLVYIRPDIGSMVRCPECNNGLFKNMSLVGEMQAKCRKCKSLINVKFATDGKVSKYEKYIAQDIF